MSLHDYDRIQERLRSVADPVGFLTNLFAHAPVGFAVWLADGRALLTNSAFFDLFRSEPPPEYNVLKDDVLAQNGMLAFFERGFAGETVQVPTFWYDPRELTSVTVTEGRRVAISMTIFPLFKANGQIDYVAATYKDMTEIMAAREIERQAAESEILRREKEAAQAANRELEAFSYSVAHDLRAPLRAMSGFAGALVEDHGDALDADARALLDRVTSAARNMGHIIDALLSLARLSRLELQRETVDLALIAGAVVDELRLSEPKREVEVVVSDKLVVTGDAKLLRVAIENLLGNAWKFTRHAAHARIELGCTRLVDATHYHVRDNGVGFSMAYADRLFAPFQRLHSSEAFEGSGVGLATVQRIVARHGGRIWAEGTEGEGASFMFTLPDESKEKSTWRPPA